MKLQTVPGGSHHRPRATLVVLALLIGPALVARDDPDCLQQLEALKGRYAEKRSETIDQRILQIPEFAIAPCDATVAYLVGQLSAEKNPGLQMAITEVLGKIGTEKAVEAVVTKATPMLIADSFNALAVARALESPLQADGEKWLIRRGLQSKELRSNEEVWVRVIKAVATFQDPDRVNVLVRELSSRSTPPALQATILRALVGVKDKTLVRIASQLVRSRELEVEAAAMALLAAQGDKKEIKIFESGLRSKSWEARLLSLRKLNELGHKKILDYAEKLLADPEPRVQVVAVRVLYDIATPEVIPLLIKRIDVSNGRVQDDIIDALARLTGRDLGPSTFQWEGWWEQNASRYPTLKKLNAEEFSELKASLADSNTVSYHGLRILSERFAFIIDSSESMKEEYVPVEERTRERTRVAGAATGKKTKIDVAKEQLTKVLNGLPFGKRFDIVRFESVITDFIADALLQDAKRLVTLDEQSRAHALAFVNASQPQGQTYMLKALETAFENEEIDTIYLLSDGAPTPPETAGMDVILARLREMNRTRNIKIHTIGIDLKPDEEKFLLQVADEHFGVFMKR